MSKRDTKWLTRKSGHCEDIDMINFMTFFPGAARTVDATTETKIRKVCLQMNLTRQGIPAGLHFKSICCTEMVAM
jgi:ethanolamine ammonia-lyase large subunit